MRLRLRYPRRPHCSLQLPVNTVEVPVAQLPPSVLGCIDPSRYCQSDRLHKFAMREFGSRWQGYSRVQGFPAWVLERTTLASNTSNSQTSALDTLFEQVDVRRDFAHLMIALCRATNNPARFATGVDPGAEPALGPIDFHACVECYRGGLWYIFDPSAIATPMGFVRFGTGRDATEDGLVVTPYHRVEALSTDA